MTNVLNKWSIYISLDSGYFRRVKGERKPKRTRYDSGSLATPSSMVGEQAGGQTVASTWWMVSGTTGLRIC